MEKDYYIAVWQKFMNQRAAAIREAKCPEGFKELKTSFEVRDALGGNVTGDYGNQVRELMANGQWCSWQTYDDADMETHMP